MQTNALYLGNGSALTLHGGDVVNSLISLNNNSVLTVQQMGGTGLTLGGTSASDLAFNTGSTMDLIFTPNTQPNWDFRWADPTGGNWISTLQSLINAGDIVINAPQGYSLVDSGGYTYIEGGSGAVPEPASLVMMALGGLGLRLGLAWKRRRVGLH